METTALCGSVARQVAGAYARRCPWVDREELEQEAWAAMLSALPGYDAARGELGGYLYGTAQRAVHRHAWRQGSSLTICPRNGGDLPALVRAAQRASVAAETCALGQDDARDAEERLDRARLTARAVALVGELLPKQRERRAVLAVLAGEASATVAEVYRVPQAWLYQATYRVRRSLRAALAA